MKTLVRNGRIVTARDTFVADLVFEDETVTLMGRDLRVDADRIDDASGLLVVPGGVDVHTHLDTPAGGTVSSDDFETGTRAAAFGGTTTIVDFAVQARGQTMRTALNAWLRRAEHKAVVDYGLHMTVTDLSDAGAGEMRSLVRDGVTSFKLFMAYPDTLMANDATIFRALQAAAGAGGLVCIHAENGGAIAVMTEDALNRGEKAPRYHALTRPVAAEAEATGRAIALAEMAGAPVYIVHVSCAEALQKIRGARDRGIPVYAETCPQYLFLSVQDYDRPGFEGARFVLTPPLRERWNQDELWKALAAGDLHVISTDHCPFTLEQKGLGRHDFSKIPNGGPGIENRVALTYDGGVRAGKISLNRWVDLVSTGPARIFGLYPKKGTIAVGSDADIVLFDPEAETVISAESHHMRVDYSLYEGRRIRGVVRRVYSRGSLIVDGNEFTGAAGRGRFLPRKCFAPY